MSHEFEKRSRIAAPAAHVFDWHRQADALVKLAPPFPRARMIERTGGIEEIGSQITLELAIGPLRLLWVAEHTHYEAGRMFRDVQRRGPFARWEHTHTVEPDGADACWLIDHVEYALPLAPLSDLLGGWFVRRQIEQLFTFRHEVTAKETVQGATPS
jgi:ligand-binding SRPBCC domain-containing protein